MKEKLVTTSKTKYKAHIEYNAQEFNYHTTAYSKSQAVCNFIWQLSKATGEPMALLMWKNKNEQIDIKVEEVE